MHKTKFCWDKASVGFIFIMFAFTFFLQTHKILSEFSFISFFIPSTSELPFISDLSFCTSAILTTWVDLTKQLMLLYCWILLYWTVLVQISISKDGSLTSTWELSHRDRCLLVCNWYVPSVLLEQMAVEANSPHSKYNSRHIKCLTVRATKTAFSLIQGQAGPSLHQLASSSTSSPHGR